MKRIWLPAVLCLVLLAGCYQQTYISLPPVPTASTGAAPLDPSAGKEETAAPTEASRETTAPVGTEAAQETGPKSGGAEGPKAGNDGTGNSGAEASGTGATAPGNSGAAGSGSSGSGAGGSGHSGSGSSGSGGSGSGNSGSGSSSGSGSPGPGASTPAEPPVTAPPPPFTDPPAPPVTDPPPSTEAPSAPPAGGGSVSSGMVLGLIDQARSAAGLPGLSSDGALSGLLRSWNGGSIEDHLRENGYTDFSVVGSGGYSVTDDEYAAETLELLISGGGAFLSPAYDRVGIVVEHSDGYIYISLIYVG